MLSSCLQDVVGAVTSRDGEQIYYHTAKRFSVSVPNRYKRLLKNIEKNKEVPNEFPLITFACFELKLT